ncbi:MAG TPA: D-aminoacylase [Bryobacteraceae bacterium]|nr:D-aminoacylase [Bryobacteraceae bacterium]
MSGPRRRKRLLQISSFLLAAFALHAAESYDLIIRNGHIIDGTGSPWYSGDIGVRGGHIATIGFIPADAEAKRVIDAEEQVVAPGFIDMLGQSELTILVNPSVPSKIFQGITTEITGEGGSVAPLTDDLVRRDRSDYEHYGIKPDWRTLAEYFQRLEHQGMGINLGTYVGATQVRRIVIGDDDRAPTTSELERMCGLVAQAMRDGAMGLSTALQYPPAPYAKTDELIALAKEAAKYGGLYASHIRSEGNAEMQAIDEAVRIGREARIPVEIWHLKAAGKSNWGRMPEIVERIDEARQSGVDVAADTYAYTAWFNSFSAFVPPWVWNGGAAKALQRLKDPATREKIRKQMMSSATDWDNEWEEIPGPQAILFAVATNPKLVPLQGKTIAEIAKMRNKDPIDTIFDLLIEDPSSSVAVFGMSEPDVELALKQPWVSIDNDSSGTSPEGILGREHPHPRAYGTFPRILRKYVREEHLLTLEDAIRKFSSLPAQRMRLADRGVLKAGMWADIVVFNLDTITEHATFEDPNRYSTGMEYVLVDGVPVVDGGRMTRALPGKVLKGPGAEIEH